MILILLTHRRMLPTAESWKLWQKKKGRGFFTECFRRQTRILPRRFMRTIRALEFYRDTGKPISKHNEQERQKASPYCFAYFVLNDARSRIYENIDRRVDEMMDQGLLQEVEGLKARGCTRSMVSMQGLGYKEILDYLDGKTTLQEAVRILKRDTRHFAKRQLTWFKRERDVIWLNKQDFDYREERILSSMKNTLQEKGILTESE